ncbi:unnamed protein product, partial [Laminaria digitata]
RENTTRPCRSWKGPWRSGHRRWEKATKTRSTLRKLWRSCENRWDIHDGVEDAACVSRGESPTSRC